MSGRRSVQALAVVGALVLSGVPAFAQSSGVTERLIELLVQKGVLARDQADALVRQAQQEAREAPARKPAAKKGAPATAAAAPSPAAPGEVTPKGTVRVTYVPEIVRQQIAEQVRHDVMQQAKSEGWAEPNVVPGWVQRIKFSGDMRMRGQFDQFPGGAYDPNNASNGANYPDFPDFQAINNGPAFDTNGSAVPPLLNTTENRRRFRLRARLGAEAQIDDWVTAGLRIATGNDSSPVSANQTLGQPGYFSKYAIWLDRAYIKLTPADWFTGYVGRAPNPFWTSDLVYYEDLNFDGIAGQFAYRHNDRLSGFLNAGAFPVFNTDLNFSSTAIQKSPSHDKYLFAVQGGGDWRIADDYAAKLAIGYFHYSNIEGARSSPCAILVSSDNCSTDLTRTQFYQYGNTMFPIRNLVPNPNNPTGGPLPEYYGLASRFGVLDLHGRFDINVFNPIGIALEGDYARNLAYSSSAIAAKGPVNNIGANNTGFRGGPNAYMVRVTVGTPQVAELWDWNVSLAYKYLESDSVVSALNDPDFHLGGTNAKGYIIGGNLGIARNAYVSARWLSANEVSGPPFGVDVLQLDLNVRF